MTSPAKMNYRINQVVEWILQGKVDSDVCKQCQSWGVSYRTAMRYIKQARAMVHKYSAEKIDYTIGFHIGARLKLYRESLEKGDHAQIQLQILMDLAKIQGVYAHQAARYKAKEGTISPAEYADFLLAAQGAGPDRNGKAGKAEMVLRLIMDQVEINGSIDRRTISLLTGKKE